MTGARIFALWYSVRESQCRRTALVHRVHACAGQGLARLEMQAILAALMRQVTRTELAGEPPWALNNIIRCYERLPLRLIPA